MKFPNGTMEHRRDKYADQDWVNPDANQHMDLIGRVQDGKPLTK